MRAVLQRVSEAQVTVDGVQIGACGKGLLILICAMPGDDEGTAQKLAQKIAKMRIFNDMNGKMNLSLRDIEGEALVVSQFTLAADTSRGNRPGFSRAAHPDTAKALYLAFTDFLRHESIPCENGKFGHEMQVKLVNDGPTTIWIDTDDW